MLEVGKMRPLMALVASVLMLSLVAIQGTPLSASSTVSSTVPSMGQMTSTVWTNHLKVQFFFPASAYPGQHEPISATATVKSSGRIVRFSIDISSYVGKQLVKIASQTIVSDKTVRSGETWQSLLVVVIPANAQRGSLIGTVTEIWEETSNYYPSYSGSQYYYTSYCPYYQDYGDYAQNNAYYSTYAYSVQDYEGYPNGFAAPRTAPQTPTQRCSYQTAYYAQNNAYYSTYTYSAQDYGACPNGFTAPGATSQTRNQRCNYQPAYSYGPSYGCERAPNYGCSYGTNYAPKSVTQSTQSVLLTHVLGCPPKH